MILIGKVLGKDDLEEIDRLLATSINLPDVRSISKAPHSQDEADRAFQESFLPLQRLFATELGIDASQLNPETEIAPLSKPLSKRRRIWKKINTPNFGMTNWQLAGTYCELY